MVIKLKISSLLILLVFISTSAGGVFLVSQMKEGKMFKNLSAAIIQPVLAADIYPMFLCPCCGKPLDEKNICCGMAEERIKYIDSLIKPGVSADGIILAYVKQYGANSFADASLEKEFEAKLAASAPNDRPKISLAQTYFDLGNVSEKAGVVFKLFDISNGGNRDLIINKIDTSCGCTSAAIVFQGKEGPRFAMAGHGIESPKDWQLVIPSGQTAQLKIYYDPSAHKGFRGPATREVYIFSNDPVVLQSKVQIDLNQVD